ncbi:MAG TPA: acireductone synthase [Xanthomonadaceae bacterium]|nr:acireductone synthase [Xanthomonadaceae bacterium]
MTAAIVTDIEGTTSSISFVRDVLFPYSRRALPDYVRAHRGDPEVRRWLDRINMDHHGGALDDEGLIAQLLSWIDEDRKDTALKALQGMVWRHGYRAGEFQAHVYEDAARALQRWHRRGIALYVYSSGSVTAQKLFFAHTLAGDLAGLFAGHFDTEIGAKRDPAAYQFIAARLERPATSLLFLSDTVEELDAAREAGLATVLVDRPQEHRSREGDAAHGHRRVESFDDIEA